MLDSSIWWYELGLKSDSVRKAESWRYELGLESDSVRKTESWRYELGLKPDSVRKAESWWYELGLESDSVHKAESWWYELRLESDSVRKAESWRYELGLGNGVSSGSGRDRRRNMRDPAAEEQRCGGGLCAMALLALLFSLVGSNAEVWRTVAWDEGDCIDGAEFGATDAEIPLLDPFAAGACIGLLPGVWMPDGTRSAGMAGRLNDVRRHLRQVGWC